MHVVVLGAGIIGTCSAWHLLQAGHEVTLVDRQSDAALETSFANAAQISVGYSAPWAHPDTPLKALGWMLQRQAPLLLRPQWDRAQWSWLLRFLRQCTHAAFERNLRQLVALARYSQATLEQMVQQTGIEYQRSQRGIALYCTDAASLRGAAQVTELMQALGVPRRQLGRDELLQLEPALQPFAGRLVGGCYTHTDEHGDARVFSQALAARCQGAGAHLLYEHLIEQLALEGGALKRAVLKHPRTGVTRVLQADAFVLACGSDSVALAQPLGVHLPVYPCKGYSATLKLLQPERAPALSLIDDECKIAVSRLGAQLRVAGTLELAGMDRALETPLARARCARLLQRIEAVFPGVADTRLPEQGGAPNFWCGLRPTTPSNVPLIGPSRIPGLWLNVGHGTLGWTLGAGSGRALARLMSGQSPEYGPA
ncbi:MAG: D-amino acid dehydrogenase [Serpentinimonas sp.]|nr:D-amino acid dehydrogenase [Serpentinimonas sp.]